MSRTQKLLDELFRRKVIRSLAAYLVAVWVLAVGVADLFPALGMPPWTVRAFVLVAILALPLVVLVSWRFNLTTRGWIRDSHDLSAQNAERQRMLAPDVARWVENRHDATGAGYVAASWTAKDDTVQQKDFFAPFVIGRDIRSDIQLTDKRVSRVHSIVWAEDGHWCVRDLDSSNGTFLDGKRVTITPLPAHGKLRFDQEGPSVELAVVKIGVTEVPHGGVTTRGLAKENK
ncbi:MAG: FHA domain-containing protein [Gammaproteobacteria bacterium]